MSTTPGPVSSAVLPSQQLIGGGLAAGAQTPEGERDLEGLLRGLPP